MNPVSALRSVSWLSRKECFEVTCSVEHGASEINELASVVLPRKPTMALGKNQMNKYWGRNEISLFSG